MPRRNLAGNWWGPSERVTLRLTRADIDLLDHLAEGWKLDRSEVLRRALREAGANERRRHRDALLAALPTMTVPQLRSLAADHWIDGRSKMNKAELQDRLRSILSR
jgi:hypothetical protein